MSLMAGFDLVAEVSREAILRLLQRTVRIDERAIVAPFDLEVPVSTPVGEELLAHMIVTQVTLDLVGDRDVRLSFHFANSSVISDTPGVFAVSLLDGVITVRVPLQLFDEPPNQKVVGADLGQAAVELQLTPGAVAKVTAALGTLPVTSAAFIQLGRQAVETYVRTMGVQKLPTRFTVLPGMIGSIELVQFERLELHNIRNLAVGLFGMLIPGAPSGNVGSKTTTAITPGHDFAVSVSPRAFHELIFCPNLGDVLNLTTPQLPPTCGQGGGGVYDGVTLTRIQDQFVNGGIDVAGNVSKSGTCYDATGSFHAVTTLSMSGSQLVSSTVVDPPYIHVVVPWYCQVVMALLGPIGLAIQAAMDSSAKSHVQDLMESMKALSGGGGAPFSTSGFPGARFDAVQVSPEGLTLNGRIDTNLPAAETPGVRLAGSVTSGELHLVSTGTFHVDLSCMEGDYSYLEYRQAQSGFYVVVPTLLGRPLTLEWSLGDQSGASAVALTAATGQATLTVASKFPFPLPGGTWKVGQVHVGHQQDINSIQLSNHATEGSYAILLNVRATDPAGNVATASRVVPFDGSMVIIDDGYQVRLAECIGSWIGVVNRKILQRERVPPWVPVNLPELPVLADFVRAVMRVGSPEADQYLALITLAHGPTLTRALGRPAPLRSERGHADQH
jgi:hypothetical protein